MRIRSIRPEFWRSEDVKKHPFEVRLLFVGLWSYVDDNGVGVDDYRQISADLFPLEDDPVAIREYVRDGLARLSRGLQITRYERDGKRLFFITRWDTHQKVDRPGKPRYLRPDDPPTSGNDGPIYGHPDDSRDLRDSLDAGEGEKGRRGEEDSGAALESHSPAPPRGRGASGPHSTAAYRLVDNTLGRRELTSGTRTALAVEVAQLLLEVDPPDIAEALRRWNRRTGIGPRVLPGLVDDIRKERRGATTRPATIPAVSPTDAYAEAFLAAGHPEPPALRALPGGA